MKLNNKGFALTSIIYMLIVLFLMIILLVLSNLAQRKVVLDKMKHDLKQKLNQTTSINTQELPYHNESTGIYYETLQIALSNAKTGDTIKVLKDVEDVSTPTLDQNKEVKIDLAGNTISLNNTLTNNGTLDIYTSEDNAEIISSNLKSIKNLGTLTINGTNSDHTMSIINSSTTRPSGVTVFENSAGTITLNKKSTITYDKESESGTAYRYIATNAGTIIVNGANLINNMDGLNTDHGLVNTSGNTNGSIIFNSGTIDTSGASLFNNGSTKNTTENPAIKVAGGTIRSSANYAIPNNITNSMIYITGGEISSTGNNTIQTAGNITMTGGTVYAYSGMGIYKYGSGNASISGGLVTKQINPVTDTWEGGANFQISGNANATITGNAVVRNDLGNGSNVIYNNGTGTLTIDGNATVENKGSVLTGTNHSTGKIVVNGGTIKSNGKSVLVNDYASSTSTKYGTIEINGGTVTTSGIATIQNISNYGKINITGGNVTAETANGSYGTIYNNKPNAIINISGGKITSAGFPIYNAAGSDNSSITMTGGELSTTGATAIYNRGNGATVTIGTLGATDNTYPKIAGRIWGDGATNGTGLITFNSGTLTGTTAEGIYSAKDITINGGTITSMSANAVKNQSTGTITISGGTIESKSANSLHNAGNMQISGGIVKQTGSNSAIRNDTSGTLSISGGIITSSGAAGISHGNGNLNITGGIITGKTYGIWCAGISTAIVNLGNSEDAVDITTPEVTATAGVGIRVESGGILNFYDGKIIGQNGSGSSISGTVTPQTGFTTKTILNGTTETTTLGWATDSNDTLLVNDSTEYHVTRTSSEAANKVIKQYTINAPFAANEVYQLEADIKGRANLHIYFYGASGYWQVQQSNPLYPITNSTTATDGWHRVSLTGDYTHFETRFTLKPTGNANVNKYLLFRLNTGDADAYVKNIKFYKINIKQDGAKYLPIAKEVYYNPTTGSKCNSNTSVSTIGTTTGCLHWYLYSIKGDYANMILDHNISSPAADNGSWATQSDYTDSKSSSAGITYPSGTTIPPYGTSSGQSLNARGPVTALNTLKSLTSGWKTETPKVPNSSSTNEHIIPSSANNNKYQINYTGYHARLITKEEAEYLGCTRNSYSCPTWMNINTTLNGLPQGYWTSSTSADTENAVWNVATYCDITIVTPNYVNYGIRPVITVKTSDVL